MKQHLLVEMLHQNGGGFVGDLPQRAHHAGRALNRRTQLVPMGTAPRFAFDPRR